MRKILFLLPLLALACTTTPKSSFTSVQDPLTRENLEFADQQLRVLLSETEAILDTVTITEKTKVEPRTIKADGSLSLVAPRDWTSGFFPGSMWYLYEMSGDDFWKEKAI